MAHPAPQTDLTPQEYLAFERQAKSRHEYLDGEISAMSSGSWEHNQIAGNLFAALHSALRGRGCSVASSDQRVKIEASKRYVYPDVLVVCGEPELEDNRRDTVLNPVLVAEVLSDSTELYDRGEKFLHYRKLPSLRHYLLLSQKEAVIEHYRRRPDGSWVLRELAAGQALELTLEGADAVSLQVALDELYADVLSREPASGHDLG
jgi:Uma2 family endonuclease